MSNSSIWDLATEQEAINAAVAKRAAAAEKATAAKEAAVSQMHAAYARYVDARSKPTQHGERWPDDVLEMQAAMLDALRSRVALPDEMRDHLRVAFEHLCAGVAFELLTPVKRPGGRESPTAKEMQEAAIRYLNWCHYGHIKDGSPTSTVGTAYGVSTRTVSNWCREWGKKPKPPPELGVEESERVELWMRLDHRGQVNWVEEAERVELWMRQGGRHYQRFKEQAKAKRKA